MTERCECCNREFAEDERRNVTDDDVYLCDACWEALWPTKQSPEAP